jgi:hypothetical protein
MAKKLPNEEDIELGLIDNGDILYSMRDHKHYMEKHIEPMKVMLFVTVMCTVCIFMWMVLPLIIPPSNTMTYTYISNDGYNYDYEIENI